MVRHTRIITNQTLPITAPFLPLQHTRHQAPSTKLQAPNICGYQYVEVPAAGGSTSGFYVFTPTFKQIGEGAKIDLKTIKPSIPGGAMVLQNQTVQLFVLDEGGDYGDPIYWCGGKGTADPMWTKDGSNPILDGEVMLGEGCGIALQNLVRVKDGKEVAKGGDYSPINFQVSGEVDLVCLNKISAKNGFQISGNSTPVAINLKAVTPRMPNGKAIVQNQTVQVFLLGDDGNYGDPIYWCGGKGVADPMWTMDGENPITDAQGALAAGQGFAVQNIARIKDGEEVAKGGSYTEVYLDLPLPIKK